MNIIQIILLVVSSLLALVFIVARTLKGGYMAMLIKTLASFAFVASSIWGIVISDATGQTKLALGLISIGLVLGMIGDILLDFKVLIDNDKYLLNGGMVSFGLGHLAYFAGFALIGVANGVDLLLPILISAGVSVLLTVGTLLSSKKMGLNFGNFLFQAGSYSFLLNFMLVFSLMLAINMGLVWVAFVGFALFLASDMVLSFQYFGGKIKNKPMIAINHLLYYSAQILILAQLFLM